MDTDPAVLIVLALAAFRLTRLVVEDSITDSLRDWVSVRSPFLSRLIDCYWCAGFWVSVGVVVAHAAAPTPTYWLALPFALSAVVGLLSTLTDR